MYTQHSRSHTAYLSFWTSDVDPILLGFTNTTSDSWISDQLVMAKCTGSLVLIWKKITKLYFCHFVLTPNAKYSGVSIFELKVLHYVGTIMWHIQYMKYLLLPISWNEIHTITYVCTMYLIQWIMFHFWYYFFF